MSYHRLLYHIAFSSKERVRFITADLKPRLVEYIGGIVREKEGKLLACNGPDDHLHLAVLLTPKYAVMDVVKEVKAGSSKWIHEEFRELCDFGWQDGYAAFSVSHSVLPKVIRYIESQEEHHRRLSFKDELIALLKRHGVEYDERYLL